MSKLKGIGWDLHIDSNRCWKRAKAPLRHDARTGCRAKVQRRYSELKLEFPHRISCKPRDSHSHEKVVPFGRDLKYEHAVPKRTLPYCGTVTMFREDIQPIAKDISVPVISN